MITNKSTLLTNAHVIQNETNEAANTANRVGSQLVNEVDTLFNTFCRIDKTRTNGMNYTISGYDPQDIQLQVVKWNRARKCWKFVSGAGLKNQHTGSLQQRFVDHVSALTARPRVTLTTATGHLNYRDDQSFEIATILAEMAKLRTIEHFAHTTGQGGEIWYNCDKAGGYYNCEAGGYGGGANLHLNSPRYGLALTYRGNIISNVLAVKIGYDPTAAQMVIKNV